jgi:uncharacterized RDD family membrane protein YckC
VSTDALPRYAGVGVRAVAWIIDTVVFFLIAWAVAAATGGTTAGGFEISGAPAFAAFAIWFGYLIAAEAVAGTTLGKRIVGLRVVKADGSQMDWSASVIRNVLRIIDGLFVYLVGAILVWRSPTRQRLGDRVADTYVVRRS